MATWTSEREFIKLYPILSYVSVVLKDEEKRKLRNNKRTDKRESRVRNEILLFWKGGILSEQCLTIQLLLHRKYTASELQKPVD